MPRWLRGFRDVLDRPAVYRAWQAPFAGKKLAPIPAHNDLRAAGLVLDVGCGPGTNASQFGRGTYVGIDLNRRYVADARRRRGGLLLAGDARHLPLSPRRFDFVLVNSVLHHLDSEGVRAVLQEVARVLRPGGYVHVLELVLPPGRSVARLLARLDRGRYARPLEEWRPLLAEHFEPVVFEPYVVGIAGVACWRMVYFKGRTRAP